MNQELIEKYRDINVNDDWWFESVYEWFEEECDSRGVCINTTPRKNQKTGKVYYEKDISWSGFWSQGDGAAFAGKINDIDKALGIRINEYPMFQKYVNELNGDWSCRWGLGSGNNIMFQGLEIEPIDDYLDDEHPFAEIWQEQLDREHELVENDFNDLAYELCGLLYKTLEDEYEAMTNDEAVWEAIVANELDKEIDDVE